MARAVSDPGLNALLTTVSTPTTAPVITECSLRRGPIRQGADWNLKQALSDTRGLVGGRQVWVRRDAAFATSKHVHAAIDTDAWCPFTVPHWPTVTRAIAAIDEGAWTPIKYPNAVLDEATGEWVSEAEVAETVITVFTSKPAAEQVTCRLVVRRMKRLGNPAGQNELVSAYRHHAFITNTRLNPTTRPARPDPRKPKWKAGQTGN